MSDAANYVLTVFQLATTDSEPVPTGRVAAELGRSPSTTTEMLQRLADQGLLTHEPYEGVTLTDEGRKRGAELQESYLVLCQFFDEVLALADPHDEAMALVGTVSPLVTDRLAATVLDVDPDVPPDTAGAGVSSD